MIAKTRGNTSEFVRQEILQDIQNGRFQPGEKLTTEGLAKRYDVSRTPVREALIQLEGEGLLAATANSGFEIRTLSVDELCELYEIREAIEGLAVEKLTRNGASPSLVAELRKCCEMRRNAEDFAIRERGDRQFHALICDSCNSPMMSRLANNYLLLSTIFNFTRYFLLNRQVGNTTQVNLEHDEITDAIEAGDAKKARKLLVNHIAAARKLIRKFARTSGDRQS